VDGTKARLRFRLEFWLGRVGHGWVGLDWVYSFLFFSFLVRLPTQGWLYCIIIPRFFLSWKGFWLWMIHSILGGWMERVELEVLTGTLFRGIFLEADRSVQLLLA
jgi:hypothetical protein